MNIAELVLRHAQRGKAEALIDYPSGRRRSFDELSERIILLGRALTEQHGLKRGDRVAVLSRNCLEYMEILLACALRGVVVQALNWRLSSEEQKQILTQSTPNLVLSHEEFAETVRELQVAISCDRWVSWTTEGGPSPFEDMIAISVRSQGTETDSVGGFAGDNDPFLVVYTGGTTGISKGAVHTHATALSAMAQNSVAERTVPSDRFLLMGQMFHSPVLLAINYLTHGCPVIMVNFKAELALEAIQEEKVTASMGIPTMFQNMLPLLATGSWNVDSLRNIQYGGSPIARSVVAELLAALGCGLIQCYGRTEELAITFLSQEDHVRAVAGIHPERLESCGREAWLTRLMLVTPEGDVIPRSSTEAGEIVAKSPGTMVGYLGRPDLTAEATFRDGWLRTGDVAKYDGHGYLYVVDRAKDLIISGGENIYPAQVERAIQRHESVLEVAVVGVPDELWGESVKAFVVLKNGERASRQDIAQTAAVNIGSYQKPKYVEFLDEMPMTSAGKVDKRSLKERVKAESATETAASQVPVATAD